MQNSSENICYQNDKPYRCLGINYGGTSNTSNATTEENDKSSNDVEPQDKYHLAKITIYLIGITCLLPWYFFMQANEYWMYKLRNVTADDSTTEETNLQVTFPTYLAIASKAPYVIFLSVNSLVANKIRPESRMQYPLIVMVLLFIIVIVMVPLNTDYHQGEFFTVTMCIIVGINVACAFVQGGGTGIAGAFPKVYMSYYVNGMALGGILASFAQILSIALGGNATSSALFYFISAGVALLVTIIVFKIAVRTDFYKFYMSKQVGALIRHDAREQEKDMAVKTNISHLRIFKKLWVYAISVTILFWVTLSMIPGVVSRVSSTSTSKNIWTGRLFLPVACFFVFNACDFGGRILAMQFPIPPRFRHSTMILVIVRVIFIPLVMLCNAKPRDHLPVVFENDASFIMIIFFFALSNGYLCNIILSQAPKTVIWEHQEIAGTQMAFFLGLGLMLGSVSSYGFVKLL